mmetsp:Transcript_17430/g.43831  ORF Transcript_17430/g.43831 Transcript_17430/m.43831 type:complete len:217 (+) Transcript_17430:233-883(+)
MCWCSAASVAPTEIFFRSVRMAAWMAVPCATASSGDTSQLGYLPPKYSRSILRTYAMRVEPPTSTTSSTSSRRMPTVESTLATGKIARSKRGAASSSYSRRERKMGAAPRRLGASCTSTAKLPPSSAASKSPPQSHSSLSSSFSRSASSRSARIASASSSRAYDGSFAFTRLTIASRTARLKSCPPSRLSPAAAITSKMPLFRLSSETSSVPPPMS